jgi:AcrR family transcriptional regulator
LENARCLGWPFTMLLLDEPSAGPDRDVPPSSGEFRHHHVTCRSMAPRDKGTDPSRPRQLTGVSKSQAATGSVAVNGSALSDREIVRAARDLIAEVGVQGLTMRRLSAKLGVALGATYHHVPTKRDLLLLVAHDLYDEVVAPEKGTWDQRVKKLMVEVAEVVARYPGMASFMNSNADDSMPVELSRAVVQILRDAGFSRRDINAVMAALFFYVTGMSSGGLSAASSSSQLRGVDIKRLFEDGLDILLAGARVRLEEDESRRRRRRSS